MNNTPDNIRNMWEQAAEISESKYGKKGVKPKRIVPASKHGPTDAQPVDRERPAARHGPTDAQIKSSAAAHAAERDKMRDDGNYHS